MFKIVDRVRGQRKNYLYLTDGTTHAMVDVWNGTPEDEATILHGFNTNPPLAIEFYNATLFDAAGRAIR